MLFQTIEFAIFFPVVFAIYWALSNRDLKWQNAWLVIASFIFYGWWDWRFLGLMIFSAGIDYVTALMIERSRKKRDKWWWLMISLTVNLGILGFFKYYNFFVENFNTAFRFFGKSPGLHTLDIILPVGISFYTLQALSYTIDVYKGKIRPTSDVIAYFGYISFFPQLVAGPIERAGNLLRQFNEPRRFDAVAATDGMRRILLGLFMKLVVADNCGRIVDDLFRQPDAHGSIDLVVGILFFPIQVYADFAGYSEMAIGFSALLGFKLMRNFAFPFLSTDIAMLWRRWHISLTNWFRDYVFTILDRGRSSKWRFVQNMSVIYILSGVWHGATWNFLIWGILNALFVGIHVLRGGAAKHIRPEHNMFHIVTTFLLFAISLSIARGRDLSDTIYYYSAIWQGHFHKNDQLLMEQGFWITLCLVALQFMMEWKSRKTEHALGFIGLWDNRQLRWLAYLTLSILILIFGGEKKPFFYFQF